MELNPVNCGCGGEAILQICESGYSWNRSRGFCVECIKCRTKTIDYQTEAEAIEAWNKAMGATDTNVGDKIIYCKDCKYSHMTIDGLCKYCDIWFPDEKMYVNGNHFCASAEKRML